MPTNKSDSTEKSHKDESTRKSAPADNRRKGRVSSVSKSSSTKAKSSGAKKKSTAKKKTKQVAGKTTRSGARTPSKDSTPINAHSFPAGTKVGIYEAAEVDVQRRENRPPIGDPVKTVTVTKAGDLTAEKLPPGHYVAAAKVDDNNDNRIDADDSWVYVQFGVVTDEERKAFSKRTGIGVS